jgi:Fructose-1,6-bisphosphatase/sedoheptulose 1,7-bisphosphatase and related proteins
MYDTINIRGTVVIVDVEMAEDKMLYIEEHVGPDDLEVEIAIEPGEGTNEVNKGQPDAISEKGMAPKGSMLHARERDMDKMLVGPSAKESIKIEDTQSANLEREAKAQNSGVGDVADDTLDCTQSSL